MANTRCKFTVIEVAHRGSHSGTVKLQAKYDSALHTEDHAFQKATPNGELTMSLNGERQMEFFKPGDVYYLDFTKVEELIG